MKIQYLTLKNVLFIHAASIENFGGSHGLRDQGLLESTIGQAEQSFGGEDLYPSLFDKASTYGFFISENQPFLDGNKRTAATTTGVFLEDNGYKLMCSEEDLYNTIMQIANHGLSREAFAAWLQKNSKPLA